MLFSPAQTAVKFRQKGANTQKAHDQSIAAAIHFGSKAAQCLGHHLTYHTSVADGLPLTANGRSQTRQRRRWLFHMRRNMHIVRHSLSSFPLLPCFSAAPKKLWKRHYEPTENRIHQNKPNDHCQGILPQFDFCITFSSVEIIVDCHRDHQQTNKSNYS